MFRLLGCPLVQFGYYLNGELSHRLAPMLFFHGLDSKLNGPCLHAQLGGDLFVDVTGGQQFDYFGICCIHSH